MFCVHGDCEHMQTSSQTNIRFVAFPQPCAYFHASFISDVSEGVKSFSHNVQLCSQCSKWFRWNDLCDNRGTLKSLVDITSQTYLCSTHFVGGNGPSEMHPDPLPAYTDARDAEVDPLMDVEKDSKASLQGKTILCEAVKAEYCASLVDHMYSKMNTGDDDYQESFGNMLALKTLGHELLDQCRSVKYDRESLSVYSYNQYLGEKCCILDRELNVNIFLLGQKVSHQNFIWQKYPKVWNLEMDFGSFIDDLFDNWQICMPFAKAKKLENATVSAMKAEGQGDKYKYDALSKCIRSVDCVYLSTRNVCCYCHRLETYLELEKRQALKRLNEFADLKCLFPKHCHFALHNLKKQSDSDCQILLDTVIIDRKNLPIGDMTILFYQELINARRANPPSAYIWDPKMINWCNLLNQTSECCYVKLRKIINVPSVARLNEQRVCEQSAEADSCRLKSTLQIRKDLFYNSAMSQPSTSSMTESNSRLLEDAEFYHYHCIEMAQQ